MTIPAGLSILDNVFTDPAERARTVGDLQAELNLDSSGTSQHLAALCQQGVLDNRRAAPACMTGSGIPGSRS